MKTSPFTTVLWRIFLHCLPRDSEQWDRTIDLSREHYDELVETYFIDERKVRNHKHLDGNNHPLSQEENVIKLSNSTFSSDGFSSHSRVPGINFTSIKD